VEEDQQQEFDEPVEHGLKDPPPAMMNKNVSSPKRWNKNVTSLKSSLNQHLKQLQLQSS
jgi:hypothetical protein